MRKFPNLDHTVKIPTELKKMKMGSHAFLVNPSYGFYPYFSVELRKRIKRKMAINITGTGEGGIGKSYLLSDICRVMSKSFDTDDIVYRYPEFLRCVQTTRRGTPIEFDEPSYAMSKKDWYKEVTKALVKTIESFRFKGKPLFIPIINKKLLEKDIRSYLLQYHIHIIDRGYAKVYRTYASQFTEKVYNYEVCKIRYGMFDNNLCNIDSCLGCKKLDPYDHSKRCNIFRAKYERKKKYTQEERYKIALEEADRLEYTELSMDEIEAKIMDDFDKFYNIDKNDIDQDIMALVLEREHKIKLGHNKQVRLKKQIRYDYPNLFEPISKDLETDVLN